MFQATILGRLGRDPETKAAGNSDVTTVAIATDHGFGERKTTTWTRCSIWGKRGQSFAQHHRKGDFAALSGAVYMRTGSDGKSYLEMDVSDWSFVGAKKETAPAPAPSRPSGGRSFGASEGAAGFDDDLPF